MKYTPWADKYATGFPQLMLPIRTLSHIGNRTVDVDKADSDGLSEPEHVALASATAAPSIHHQSSSSGSSARALPAPIQTATACSRCSAPLLTLPVQKKRRSGLCASECSPSCTLIGTLIVSPYQAVDEHGITGTLFVLPDLSCRTPGCYRLCFKFLRIDMHDMRQGAVHSFVPVPVPMLSRSTPPENPPG